MTAIFRMICKLAFGLLWFALSALPCGAEGPRTSGARSIRIRTRPPEFPVGRDVQGKIDFWKLIFTKYGENELVFHHREHPEIIYSVLDLTEYAENYSGKELSRLNSQAIEEEYDHIRAMLRELASGKKAVTPAERRLVQLFSQIPGRLSTNLQEAMEEDNLRYQRGIKERFRAGLIRSGRYLPAMERVFVEAGLPPELTRIPLIESSFDYTAYSSVGAAGIWQFMRGTGKRFLRITNAVDERRDPIIATRAAARYLAEAYSRIQSWPLSVTSYNHGVSGIMRAISATGTKDLDVIIQRYDGASFGFASKNFFPEFMAALEVEQNMDRYFPGVKKEDPWQYEEVYLGKAVTMPELVRFSGAEEEDIIRLNRAFMQPIASGRARIPAGYTVNIPVGGGRRLLAKLGKGEILSVQNLHAPSAAAHEVARKEDSPVIVSRGDAAAEPPARESTASVSDPAPDVAVPVASRPERREQPKPVELTQTAALDSGGDAASIPAGAFIGTSYTVRVGDSLPSIARDQGVALDELLAANGLEGETPIRSGQKLLVPNIQKQAAPSVPTAERSSRSNPPVKAEAGNQEEGQRTSAQERYTVRAGDTLGSIAKGAGMSLADLQRLNPGVSPKALKPGISLRLAGSASRAMPRESSRGGSVAEKHYAVQKGDTLAGISRKLGMPLKRLQALNPKLRQPLRVGQEILVGGR